MWAQGSRETGRRTLGKHCPQQAQLPVHTEQQNWPGEGAARWPRGVGAGLLRRCLSRRSGTPEHPRVKVRAGEGAQALAPGPERQAAVQRREGAEAAPNLTGRKATGPGAPESPHVTCRGKDRRILLRAAQPLSITQQKCGHPPPTPPDFTWPRSCWEEVTQPQPQGARRGPGPPSLWAGQTSVCFQDS